MHNHDLLLVVFSIKFSSIINIISLNSNNNRLNWQSIRLHGYQLVAFMQ